MKFAALALVLLASLFASLAHGAATVPGCAETVVVGVGTDTGDAAPADGTDGNDMPDDVHCGFGLVGNVHPEIGSPWFSAARIGTVPADLLLGRDRMPDERPPDRTRT
ncbi:MULTISPECIES: hypothetical protein [Aureimonas]|uniref:Uncharacterized protein n=2 Tax=Aureimonas TaxID=414371 RepID=A0A1H0HDX5_9HYPH|nr:MULTISPECIES: hypothetical protein [Aureimonas]MBB3934658.1 hypothetical protein [Aureimonas phyllosphaerae]MBB3950531.1 hypothetical protein [Aureimonas jatrophae]MBB3958126.1 hypothetical protein [Aureimonas phyllosphaerae]SDO17051.1 hypothetical protein SAMN05192530_10440 [Aureimonas jatrophae]SFE92226.1 hypothetical protein SAMN05216566_10197 [Aureimonas phyllosphaerae]